MGDLAFLKLGGSLITDKLGQEAARHGVLARLAREIARAMAKQTGLMLLLGHGSGSFGHVAAAKYHTRQGVQTAADWRGFADVSAAAARLNRLVTGALLDADVPAVSLQPSASAICEDGQIRSLATAPIEAALGAGLVPVIYGDVAFDSVRGGTIISTEEIMMTLTAVLQPKRLLLAGETDGVFDAEGQVIPSIDPASFGEVESALGASRGTDVTGGMASKVRAMVELVEAYPSLTVHIFSGLRPGELEEVLLDPATRSGTLVRR
jgi:isopentenyl phosphate kinase